MHGVINGLASYLFNLLFHLHFHRTINIPVRKPCRKLYDEKGWKFFENRKVKKRPFKKMPNDLCPWLENVLVGKRKQNPLSSISHAKCEVMHGVNGLMKERERIKFFPRKNTKEIAFSLTLRN